MGAIFGKGGKSKNVAYPALQGQLGGTVGAVGTSSNALMKLLGLEGDASAQEEALGRFRESSGYEDQFQEGQRAVEGSAAGRGILNSGATLKALTQYGQGQAKQSMGDYLDKIFNLGNLGLGAGGILSQAGQTTKGGKPGLGSALGSIGAAVATKSDRRAKKDIVQVGELPNGLGLYEYNYLWDEKDEPYEVIALMHRDRIYHLKAVA